MSARQKTNVCRLGIKTVVVVMLTAMVMAVFAGTVVAQNMSNEVFEENLQVSVDGITPDIAVDSANNIYVVWEDSFIIYFAKSTDGGNTFGAAVQVSHTFESSDPSITVDADDNVHIAWQQGGVPDIDIKYAKSTDHGISFTTPVTVNGTPGENTRPDIASHGNNVYIVWNVWDEDERGVSLDRSIKGGGFGADVRVHSVDDRPIGKPAIAIGTGETIYIVWADAIGFGRFNARLATSTDQGLSFSASVKVNESKGVHQPCIVAIGTDTVYVVYDDVHTARNIQFAKSTNKGVSFSPPVDVSDVDGGGRTFGFQSTIAVHPCGKIFVVWRDDRSDQGEIYFASSTDGGESFDGDVKVTDVSPAEDRNDHREPSLAVGDDTQVYVVWRDVRAGSGQIYFAKAYDATWPNKIDDLEATEATPNSITLSWTAPGDNFHLGTATTYDIRYSTTPITGANWASAIQYVGEPSPQEGGSRETFEIMGLSDGAVYYFAIKTADERNNTSVLSNIASKKELTGSVVFQIDTTTYFVDNQVPGVEMDAAPFVKDGRTLVPVRFLANALGVGNANISFKDSVVTLSQPGFPVVKLTIGEKIIDINGEITTTGIAPLIEGGRTMLPARFVAEALGYQVTWLAEQRVVLAWPQGEPQPEIGKVLEHLVR